MANRKYKRRKKEQNMGRVILLLGSCLKIIQIIGAALSVSFLTGSVVTTVTTCLLVGGLCVYAIESMDLTAAFAMVGVVGLLGGMIPDGKPFYSFAFMAIGLIGLGGMLLFSKRLGRVLLGIVTVIALLLLGLQFFGVLVLDVVILTVILVLAYALFALGLFI